MTENAPDLPATEQAPTLAGPETPTAYSDEHLAYGDDTPTEPIEARSWALVAGVAVLVTVLGIVVAVLVWLVGSFLHEGRTPVTLPSPTDNNPGPRPPLTSAVPTTPEPPPAPPPVPTVTVTLQDTPAPSSLPPLATPEARIAEPIICSLHNQYPEMQPVDLALSLVDRGIYRGYDEARVVVDLVLKDGCHGI
ncbi:hypothetical protein ABQE69_09230 [Mycolicibacillus trivialis]